MSKKQLLRKLILCLTDTSEMALNPHRSLQRICSIVGDFMIPSSPFLVRPDLSAKTLDTGLAMVEHILNYLRYTLEVNNESFKPIDKYLLDRMRLQITAIEDNLHLVHSPANDRETKERSARLSVYIDDLIHVLQHPATREESSKLHQVKHLSNYLIISCSV